MAQAAAMTLGLKVSDVSGQKAVRATAVPLTSTIGELVQGLLAKLGLARHDAEGRPLHYHARLEREGRHLNGSELVGDSVQDGDELTLAPNIEAGGY
ncbi:MAG TPA: hypothetical protein VMW56_30955 [Candidatus Margulisiibacteriota bacterium]|nr:hypothetical protein [Candidatus Margulisiibacteriota bacterium]